MQLNTINAIVTGASSGLGESVARHLIEAGARIVLADLNEQRGQALAEELGGNARFVKTNITDEHQVLECIDECKKHFGPVNGLVNCAGIGDAARVLGRNGVHPLASFERSINVNLIGTFNVIRLVADAMQHTPPNDQLERGVIINTASVAAYEGQIGQAAYAASKGGLSA